MRYTLRFVHDVGTNRPVLPTEVVEADGFYEGADGIVVFHDGDDDGEHGDEVHQVVASQLQAILDDSLTVVWPEPETNRA